MPTHQENVQEMAEKTAREYSSRVEYAGIQTARVKIEFWGKQPEFQVETFRLINHPKADTVFAWKWPLVQKERNKPCEVITRLKAGNIYSPFEAVSDWSSDIL